MRVGIFVAVCTLHSGRHFVQSELPPRSRIGRMASKTAEFILLSHQPSCRFSDIARYGSFRTQRRTEALDIPEITNAALIELPVFYQDESLADRGTGPHYPADRKSERFRSIGDGVVTLRAFALDAVGVLPYCQRKQRTLDERLAVFDGFQRVSHRSVRLGFCLRVTLGAR